MPTDPVATAAVRCSHCGEAPEHHIAALCRLYGCRDPQCRQFNHRCPGCGNDLHSDNFCMVSACEQEV